MLYDKIKSLAKEKRVPICEIEKQAGLANGCISKWNTTGATFKNVIKVAELLGVSLDELAKEEME